MDGDGDRFEQLLQQAGERVRTFLKELENAPAMTAADPENLHELFGTPPGEQPRPTQELLDLAFEAAGTGVETAGPRFFGYIPGGGVPTSAVGELIARTINRYTGMADLAPGLVALEDGLVRWLASVFGLPAGAGGLLTTGGSQAMLSMVLAAREHHLGEELSHGRIYLSDQAHHSVRKAARIAGFPARSIRLIPTVDGRRLDPAAAAEAIAEDRAHGLRPFLWSARAAPPTPVSSIRSTSSPIWRRRTACGSTWTAATAGFSG